MVFCCNQIPCTGADRCLSTTWHHTPNDCNMPTCSVKGLHSAPTTSETCYIVQELQAESITPMKHSRCVYSFFFTNALLKQCVTSHTYWCTIYLVTFSCTTDNGKSIHYLYLARTICYILFPLGPYSINIKLRLTFQLIKFNYAKCTTFPLLLTRRRIKSKHFITLLKNYTCQWFILNFLYIWPLPFHHKKATCNIM